ncbi:hypothetical protein HYR99_06435 [Candidatus Poribacteria bacterium]|nr:hypothetical protein [Candidatus Poribacteria bacterium]
MKRKWFATLAGLMCIAFWGALPSISLAKEGEWTKKADMPTARAGLSTSVVDGKIYAIGGVSFVVAEFSTVEEYDTGLPQSVNPAGKFPTLWGKVKVGK